MPIDLNVTGAAVLARTSGSMTPTVPGAGNTFTVDSDSGYPLSGKFAVVVDRGLASEETILINSRSGTTFTVGSRGYDGTTATDHAINATVELDLTATIVQALINHENGTDANPHSGILLNNAAHDVTPRHTFGAALGTPGTPVALTPDIAGAAGSGTVPARSDHVHNVPATSAQTITGANAEGVGASFARNDHGHAIGGTNHIPAAAMVNKSIGAAQITDGAIVNGSLLGTGQHLTYIQAGNPGAVGANAIWFNTTKRTLLIRNAANTAWEVLSSHGFSVQYTPTLGGCNVGDGVNVARYTRNAGRVIADGFVKFGPVGSSVPGNITVGLPPLAPAKDYTGTYTTHPFYFHGAAFANDASAGTGYGAVGRINIGAGGDSGKIESFVTAGSFGWASTLPFAWAVGDSFSWFCEYEPNSHEDANFV